MIDDPEFDGTPGAHPAWWRGQDQAIDSMCRVIDEILDGRDDGTGVASDPWETTRRKLIRLRQQKAALLPALEAVRRWVYMHRNMTSGATHTLMYIDKAIASCKE